MLRIRSSLWLLIVCLALIAIFSGCDNETKEDLVRQDNELIEIENEAVKVAVTDYQFDTAGNLFAYSEFELSGEPMLEGLGLDLDLLDPAELDSPTPFDYTAGVESYEYSEEAMYEVVEKSGLGLHLVNGPMIMKTAQSKNLQPNEVLAARFLELADAVGYPKDEIFAGMFPTFIEYVSGDPHYPQAVDTGVFAEQDDTYTPKYQVDFTSLRWNRDLMDKKLVPSAYGAAMLKQALWTSDFLGGLHTVDTEEELEGQTSSDDNDQNIKLGVSPADGMQGMILAEEIWNKLAFIRDGLFYDASAGKLVSGAGSSYDPKRGLVYLPHEIAVTEIDSTEFPGPQAMKVTDTDSILQDQWLMLWPLSEYYGVTDQREENVNRNPAFGALFDGAPFPSSPTVNTDDTPMNNVNADDPFSLSQDLLIQLFRNIQSMHWNDNEGILISEHDGKTQGIRMDTFDAGYTLEALRIFQRAIDGLPVGYASGDDVAGLGTKEGQEALAIIKKQADFIIDSLIGKDGLVANGWTIGKGADSSSPSLKSQLGAIKGLTAAFLATKDVKYRNAARDLYDAMDRIMWDSSVSAYRTSDNLYQYDAFTAGAVSGVFRAAINTLRNGNGDTDTPQTLELETMIERYTDFYDQIVDGPAIDQGMQASEFWDTGDQYRIGDTSGNTDKDHVPQIQAGHGDFGIAPILLPVEIVK